MDSIGPYFYNLAPQCKALRIEEFATQITERNPGISLYALAMAIRGALASMSKRSGVPKVEMASGVLEIRGARFHLTIAPNMITCVLEESAP